jgi:hypothetical protein
MKNYRSTKIVYSINVNDLQEVANDTLSRALTQHEIELVERSVGNYIDWFQAIELAIQEHVDDQSADQ